MPSDEWYRQQYRGHDEELISSKEILESTGYTRNTLVKWKSRYADMPEVVCKKWRKTDDGEVRSHGAFDLYWVRVEMEPFLAKRLERARTYRRPEDRDERYIAVSARLRENQQRLRLITEKEKQLKAELTQLREEREQIWHRSIDDRRFIAAYEREQNHERALEGEHDSPKIDEEV